MNDRNERWWRREHRDIEERLAGRGGGRHINKRDPVALAVGIANLFAFFFTWVWWARGVDSDLASLKEWRVEEVKLKREESREKVDVDALQTTQIVELKTDVKYMKETLERIDRKIPERGR